MRVSEAEIARSHIFLQMYLPDHFPKVERNPKQNCTMKLEVRIWWSFPLKMQEKMCAVKEQCALKCKHHEKVCKNEFINFQWKIGGSC